MTFISSHGVRWTPTTILCAVSALAATSSVLTQVPKAALACIAPSPVVTTDELAPWMAQHEVLMSHSVNRFVGRSVFFPPPPPHVREVKPTPVIALVAEPSRLNPAPDRYDGPALTGILAGDLIGDWGEVLLVHGVALHPSEAALGITLLAILDSGHVRLRYEKPGHEAGEYLVPLWPDRTHGFVEHGSTPAASSSRDAPHADKKNF